MPATRGLVTPPDLGSFENPGDYSALVRQVYVNEYPLMTRLDRDPTDSDTFDIISYDFRPRTYTLGAALADTTGTTITLNDVSHILVGDVLELVSGERVEITGSITVTNAATGAGTAAMRRGREGTTAATQADASAVRLVGNSRTGAEIDQEAKRNPRSTLSQYIQTWQFPVQVGGLANALRGLRLTPGAADLFGQNRAVEMEEMSRDIEYTSCYGLGEAPSVGGRAKQKGIRKIIGEGASGNLTTSPTNAGAYKVTDLFRDTIGKAMVGGGAPDLLLVSNEFIGGIVVWGQALLELDAGATALGTPIEEYAAPFLASRVRLIRAPMLKPYTAVALTSSEVRMRYVRQEFWNERGNRGDAVEGEWIASMAIELENPAHHAWVEGITSFSA